MNLLKEIVSIKNAVIVLILTALIICGYVYFKANGQNLAWCFGNINACRVARIQALEKDYSAVQPQVAAENE